MIGFAVLLVLARLLTPEDFGLVALATVVLAFVQLFTEQGFEEVVIQRRELHREHLDTAFWVCVLVGSVAVACLVVAAPMVAAGFGDPRLVDLILVLAPTVLLASASKVQVGLLKREFAFRGLALRQLLSSIVGGGVAVWMALRGLGVWSLVGRQVAESVVAFLLLWRVNPWRPGFAVSWTHFREMFRFGSSLFLANVLGFLSQRADSLIVGYHLGSVLLGYYTLGQRFFQLVLDTLHGATNQAALPLFSKLQHDPQRLREAYLRVSRFTSLVAFPAFAFIAVFGGDLVVLLAGERWSEAAPIVQVLAVGGLLFSVSYFNSTIMKAMGKSSWVLLLVALNGVTNLAAFLITVRWGIVAVAAAFVVRAYLVYPINFMLTKRLILLSARNYLTELTPAAVATACAVAPCLAMMVAMNDLDSALRLAISVPAYGLLYVLVLRLLFPGVISACMQLLQEILRRGWVRG